MTRDPKHLDVLDGWRGVSILCVLLSHLAPLDGWGNLAIGIVGMVLFFNLSGFLITSLLLKPDAGLAEFLTRRFFRIIPLAWLYFIVVFCFQQESVRSIAAHFLFYANLPPKDVRLATDHMWSLCVEVQFYIGIALLFGLFRQRGLVFLPLIAIGITALRIFDQATVSTITWFRADEILAGCVLALAFHGRLGVAGHHVVALMKSVPQWALVVLLGLSCLTNVPAIEWLNYVRPYCAALLIGATMVNHRTLLYRWLNQPWLFWLAGISYAVYVIHVALIYTWLGSGDLVEKYAKRPLLLLVLFALAYLSTRLYEQPMIGLGKRLAQKMRGSHIIEKAA